MTIQTDIAKFNELIKKQMIYGGKKYALNNQRESTDELFEHHGKNWLFGTCDKYCYSEDTEILTDQGWKYFKDLNKTEKVATLNPKTNKCVYQSPSSYQKIKYEFKKIYSIKNSYVDLEVSPFHSVYYAERNGRFKLGSVEKLISSPKGRYYFKLSCDKQKGKKLKTIKVSEFSFPAKEWVQFLGWFLSEGSTTYYKKSGHYITSIAQSVVNRQKRLEIEILLKKLKFQFSATKNDFRIYSKSLYSYLKQFGKSEDKFIPDQIKSLDYTLLEILMETLIKGDGHYKKYVDNKHIQYFTVSPRLADDFQEIAFKLGYHTIFSRIQTKNYLGYNINGRKHDRSLIKEVKTVENNNEYVYDVTVPKYHTLYVKRNGKPCWSGNCYRFTNLSRERNLLKVACYMYILWLKRGFFFKKGGLIDVIDTTIEMKEKHFNMFSDSMLEILEQWRPNRILDKFQNRSEKDKLKFISSTLKYFSQKDWVDVSEELIIGIYFSCYLIWFPRYANLMRHDEDNENEADGK